MATPRRNAIPGPSTQHDPGPSDAQPGSKRKEQTPADEDTLSPSRKKTCHGKEKTKAKAPQLSAFNLAKLSRFSCSLRSDGETRLPGKVGPCSTTLFLEQREHRHRTCFRGIARVVGKRRGNSVAKFYQHLNVQ